MTVTINGIKYVPYSDLNECLKTLTEMRYFNEHHKMKKLAWNAIRSISEEIAGMSESEAYDKLHGNDK